MALFTSSQGYNARNDQLVTIGVTLIGAAAALGLKQNFDEVLLGVPAALLLLMTYALQVDTDVRIMGLARERLEQVLERQLGAPGLIYQSQAIQFRRGSYIRGIEWVGRLVLLVAAGTAVAGGFVAWDLGRGVMAIYVLLLTALAVCLGLAVSERKWAQRDAKRGLEGWASGASPK